MADLQVEAKREAVLRVLRGETLETVASEVQVAPHTLQAWHDLALAAMVDVLPRPALSRGRSRLILSALVGAIYYFSNPEPHNPFDYTLRIAQAMLTGHLGLSEAPPGWLNEMIPWQNHWYSAFPLGSALLMLPFALLQRTGLSHDNPSALVVALIAAGCTAALDVLAGHWPLSEGRRRLVVLFPTLATWMWTNLAFGGAWHINLGLAVLGQVVALAFILARRQAWWAGLGFAMAFGCRAETLVVLPALLALLWPDRKDLIRFLVPVVVLGLLTLGYNAARFGSPFDFGYMHIPGVSNEGWYQHGLFSVQAVPGNAHEMLFTGWRLRPQYPYVFPTGFGGCIFLSCPYLFYLLRRGARDPKTVRIAWGAVGLLLVALWTHGNPGGWQFCYRYAMLLLPWFSLLFLETSPVRVSRLEWGVFGLSVTINLWATWLFLWTKYVQP
ncbi:MAG TPA: hypothetical protein VGO93_27455 [Candidatus Xenobia bacterium]|jgi:hypothetical protein